MFASTTRRDHQMPIAVVAAAAMLVGGVAFAQGGRLQPVPVDPADEALPVLPAIIVRDTPSPDAGRFGDRPPVLTLEAVVDLAGLSAADRELASLVPGATHVIDVSIVGFDAEHVMHAVTMATGTGDAVTIGYQTFDPAWDVNDLVEPGDDLRIGDDGSDVIIRDRRPVFIQVLVVGHGVIANVVAEKRPGDTAATVSMSPEELLTITGDAMRVLVDAAIGT